VNESNVIPKILKINIIHNYNYLINEKYNIIVKTYMNKIPGLKKKINIFFINVKNFNNHLTCNFEIIREVIITSLNKVEKKFV
jgi:hypothetical protein